MYNLSKKERLYSKTAIARLLKEGKFGYEGFIKFCWLYRPDGASEGNRIMVSVSKRFFKRAVKRNLLKRRLREAYRHNKLILDFPGGCDLMLIYNSKEVAQYKDILPAVEKILTGISDKINSSLKEVATK